MATSYLEDKSKYRTTVSGNDDVYAVDDKIGRRDYVKVKVTTEYATEYGGTVSGTEGAILV
jgi:hypothetical protein